MSESKDEFRDLILKENDVY